MESFIEKLKKIDSLKELNELEITNFKDAIRAKCYDCCVYEMKEIKACNTYSCPLWAFRLGVKPKEGRLKAVQDVKSNLTNVKSSSN